MIINLKYYIHFLLQSKYKLLFQIFIYILIYLSFSQTSTVYCMNDGSSSSYNFNLTGLLTERNNLYDHINFLTHENIMLSKMVKTLQNEKNEILVQYEFALETERLQSKAYKQTLEPLQTQHILVKQELHEARQTIEALTNDLLDQKINLLSQQQISEPSQALTLLPKKREFVDELLAGFSSDDENITKKQKQK